MPTYQLKLSLFRLLNRKEFVNLPMVLLYGIKLRDHHNNAAGKKIKIINYQQKTSKPLKSKRGNTRAVVNVKRKIRDETR